MADFRVGGRIFATLWEDQKWGMVRLTLEQREVYMRAEPGGVPAGEGGLGGAGCDGGSAGGGEDEGAVWGGVGGAGGGLGECRAEGREIRNGEYRIAIWMAGWGDDAEIHREWE